MDPIRQAEMKEKNKKRLHQKNEKTKLYGRNFLKEFIIWPVSSGALLKWTWEEF